MKPGTIKLLGLVSGIYIVLLVLFRSLIPETVSSTISLLAIPLILLAVVLALDLADRATLPTPTPAPKAPRRVLARDVQFLTRQIEVAAKASPAYFETILRSRLRELLVERVSLETGIEKDTVKRSLLDPSNGLRLLGDPELHSLLYYTPPRGAEARLKSLKEIIDRIEGWKA